MQKLTTLLFLCLFMSTCLIAQFSVGSASFSFTGSANGNQPVTGDVYYPANSAGANVAVANGQFPIIVFGHGFGIATSEYSVWWNDLVPQGYIMIFPDTEGSVFPFPDHGEFGEDMSYLVDAYLAENSNSTSAFFNRLNGKAAVMGHSMGGGCSFLAADGNPNVTTQVSLAAADTNPSAIAAAPNLTIPALVIAGSADCVAPPASEQVLMYNALTAAPYKAYVEILNGSHCQFGLASGGSICTLGEFCGGFITAASQHQQMLDIVTPWFDYFLKMEVCAIGDFQNYIVNNDPTLHSHQESGTPPSMMMAGTASNVMGTTATINWAAQTGVTNYTIQYRPVGTTTWMTTTSTGTSTNLTGLSSSTNYEFVIIANCANGLMPASPAGTFTTTNNCLVNQTFTVSDHGVITQLYQVSNTITSTGVVLNGADITYHAGNYIDLLPDFEVRLGGLFLADIVPCVP